MRHLRVVSYFCDRGIVSIVLEDTVVDLSVVIVVIIGVVVRKIGTRVIVSVLDVIVVIGFIAVGMIGSVTLPYAIIITVVSVAFLSSIWSSLPSLTTILSSFLKLYFVVCPHCSPPDCLVRRYSRR